MMFPSVPRCFAHMLHFTVVMSFTGCRIIIYTVKAPVVILSSDIVSTNGVFRPEDKKNNV